MEEVRREGDMEAKAKIGVNMDEEEVDQEVAIKEGLHDVPIVEVMEEDGEDRDRICTHKYRIYRHRCIYY